MPYTPNYPILKNIFTDNRLNSQNRIFTKPYFQMTYTPPSSTVSVKFTDFGYTDTPQSEDNYGWPFTYGQTVANGAYADGYTALGEWILTGNNKQ